MLGLSVITAAAGLGTLYWCFRFGVSLRLRLGIALGTSLHVMRLADLLL